MPDLSDKHARETYAQACRDQALVVIGMVRAIRRDEKFEEWEKADWDRSSRLVAAAHRLWRRHDDLLMVNAIFGE